MLKPLILAAVMAAPSLVFAASPAPPDRAVADRTTSAGQGTAYFDWLAPRAPDRLRPSETSLKTEGPGKGSWICSASGFGQKSRCYRH